MIFVSSLAGNFFIDASSVIFVAVAMKLDIIRNKNQGSVIDRHRVLWPISYFELQCSASQNIVCQLAAIIISDLLYVILWRRTEFSGAL